MFVPTGNVVSTCHTVLPLIMLFQTCVTAVGWQAGNTRFIFVRPESNLVGARAGLLQLPGLLRDH